ncbi:hypothetical protein KDL29_11985 [bacterium]|nr:hypothetical protein [bacterium]
MEAERNAQSLPPGGKADRLATEPAEQPRAVSGTTVAEAADRVERVLADMLDNAADERRRSLAIVYALLAAGIACAVSPMLLFAISSAWSYYFNAADSQVALTAIGALLAIAWLATGYARVVAPGLEASGNVPQPFALGFVSGRFERDRQHVRRSLLADGSAQQVLQAAMSGATDEQLRQLLDGLARNLAVSGARPGLWGSLRLMGLRWLHFTVPLAYMLLLSIFDGYLAMFCLLSVPLLLLAVLQAAGRRGAFLLRHIGNALRPALAYFRSQGSLQAGRGWYDNVPPEVQVQSGSGSLALLSSQLQAELHSRGSWMGRFVAPAYTMPLFLLLFVGSLITLTILQGGEGSLGMGSLFGMALVAMLAITGARALDSHALLHYHRMRLQCGQHGLLAEMAMGSLPVDALRESCPVFLQPLLFRPGRPQAVNARGAEHCWTLLWNAAWFCGEDQRQLRQRWLSYLLLPVATLLLAPATILVFSMFAFGESYFASGAAIPLLSLLLLCIGYIYYFRMLQYSAEHLAAALAVADELEEIIAEGEGS